MCKVTSVKYLGVKPQSNLRWNKNTAFITGKASSRLGYIRRTIPSSLPCLREKAYKQLARPILEYSCTVWNATITKTQSNQLEAIQRRAARTIKNLPRTDHVTSTTKLVEELGWDDLRTRREHRRIAMFRAMHFGEVATNTCDYVQAHHPSSLQTRSHGKQYLVPHCRTKAHQNSFFLSTAKLWNALPPSSSLLAGPPPPPLGRLRRRRYSRSVHVDEPERLWTYGYATLLKPSPEVSDYAASCNHKLCIMAVSPVLKTSITKSNVSTSSKLRFYVKRELDVTGEAKLTRLSLYNIFKSMCDQELNYQELTSDLSISCFCRTGVVDTSVILEADSNCCTIEELLQNMTLTTDVTVSIAKYISTLAAKTCICQSSMSASLRKSITTQFRGGKQRETIARRVFEEPLRKAQSIISPSMSRFGEKDFLKQMDKLTETFLAMEKSVSHGNFTSNNIVLKDSSCCGAVIAFGSELSHLGCPIYDVGTFISDLFSWYYIHKFHPDASLQREKFCETLKECIVEFLCTYFDKFFLLVDDDAILTRLLGVAAGYAGVAMLFRAVGNDWNNELPIGNGSVRTAILSCACRLIDGYEKIETFSQLVCVGLMLP